MSLPENMIPYSIRVPVERRAIIRDCQKIQNWENCRYSLLDFCQFRRNLQQCKNATDLLFWYAYKKFKYLLIRICSMTRSILINFFCPFCHLSHCCHFVAGSNGHCH